MKIQNSDYIIAVHKLFKDADFMQHIGAELIDLGPGWVKTEIALEKHHRQHHGFVHAGVQASLADHSAGAAAHTLIGEGELVLSVEFKINLLRPATGDVLRCHAQVLKAGKRLSIVESEVFAQDKLSAKATVTLAILAESDF